MVDVVLVALAARHQHARLGGRLAGGHHAHLGAVLAHDGEHHEGLAARVAHADVEVLVGLEIHRRVRTAQRQAVQPVAALRGLVLLRVEERGAVGGPRERRDAHRGIAREAARGELLHVQRVLAEAREIDRVGEQTAVGAHVEGAHGRVRVALRELVLVEQHLLGRLHGALAPAVDGVLQALDLALVIPVLVVPVGHALVGLLDAREHLAVQRVAELGERARHLLRVAVLGVEVFDHPRVRLVAQPEIRVHAPLAEATQHLGLARRDRRGGAARFRDRVGRHGGGFEEHGAVRLRRGNRRRTGGRANYSDVNGARGVPLCNETPPAG